MSEPNMNNDLPTDALNELLEQFNTVTDTLTLFKMQITTLQQHVKTIKKNVEKELKNNKKEKNNIKIKNIRSPSGFAKPTKVTKELCEFMDRPEGTEIARTEVTKTLVAYIKNNNLLDKTENKIVPDQKLLELLGVKSDEFNDTNLTYFTIQKYMNKHFTPDKLSNLVV
jgi:chromatin remodeling complex protein RSC6